MGTLLSEHPHTYSPHEREIFNRKPFTNDLPYLTLFTLCRHWVNLVRLLKYMKITYKVKRQINKNSGMS